MYNIFFQPGYTLQFRFYKIKKNTYTITKFLLILVKIKNMSL